MCKEQPSLTEALSHQPDMKALQADEQRRKLQELMEAQKVKDQSHAGGETYQSPRFNGHP